ncbi:vitamin K epoxide reductase family protein [Timonella senegalensis]|uniref:vitamin K epoxide reductase family protein n=1 Tax=Timonella senegalensis TaxID=1465825 RepID=UPI002FE0843E
MNDTSPNDIDQEFDFSEELEASRRISDRTLGLLLTILGGVAFIASMALSIEKYLKLINPDRVASCAINIFLDCSDAMASAQGAIFGFPNPYIGVAAFAVVVTVGVSILAGAKYPKWFMIALFIGTALFEIYILCLYCMVVWAMMFPLFWYQLVYLAQERFLPASEKTRTFLMRNKHMILPLFYLLVIVWIGLGMGDAILNHIRYN